MSVIENIPWLLPTAAMATLLWEARAVGGGTSPPWRMQNSVCFASMHPRLYLREGQWSVEWRRLSECWINECQVQCIPVVRSTVLSTEMGFEAIERLCFLASFPLPGTGKRE